MPSSKERFNIISYFDMTPAVSFAPLEDTESKYHQVCEQLRHFNDEEPEKVISFTDWIRK